MGTPDPRSPDFATQLRSVEEVRRYASTISKAARAAEADNMEGHQYALGVVSALMWVLNASATEGVEQLYELGREIKRQRVEGN